MSPGVVQSKQRSYSREKKLSVVAWYEKNGRNVSATARHFDVAPKRVRDWRDSKEKIEKQAVGSRAAGRGRTSFYPLMEKRLYDEFAKNRREGRKIKRWWFMAEAKELMKEMHPHVTAFKYSEHWFKRFRVRFNQSFRRATHVAQKAPEALSNTIAGFHRRLHDVRESGVFAAADIGNMDQTPLPFILDDGTTYNQRGEKEIWCVSGPSGLDKRQCTVQLTAFADGVNRVRPLIIFRGQGKRLAKKEKDAWDGHVRVMFQENAWCDGAVMKEWVSSEWGNVFTNKPSPGSSGKILVADMHRAQQIHEVVDMLRQRKTTMVAIPAGCTSRIQPLDVSLNKPFKDAVRQEHERHQHANLELYTTGKISASERRVLITKWVAKAWQKISDNKDMVVRSFQKCGLFIKLYGSEDGLANIEGLPNYRYRVDNTVEVRAAAEPAASAADPTTVPASAGVATEPATAAVERIGIDESDDDDVDWSGDDCGSDDEIVLH